MNTMVITDFLTEDEVKQAQELFQKYRGTGLFVKMVREAILDPNMARINAALGQENDPAYLGYALEYVFTKASE